MDAAWGPWVLGGLGLVAVLVVADRLVARLPARTGTRTRHAASGSPGAGMFAELIGGFQPGIRHLQEETERQKHDLVLPGDADPQWQVDLEAGVVHLPAAQTARVLTHVAPGVLTSTATLWSSLTTVVVGPDGRCLLVDPGVSPAELAGLAVALGRRGLVPVAGFSTHPHWDHVLWSAALGGGVRWATREAARRVGATQERTALAADEESPGHDHTLTGRVVGLPVGASTVPWDGPEVLVVPYQGHCAGSAALFVRAAAVLIAGDVLSDREVPLLDLEARDPLDDYLATLETLERVMSDGGVRVLVPGHGSVAHGGEIKRRIAADRRYLDALAGGGAVQDPRLEDPWVRQEHQTQVAHLRGQHGSGRRT
jgi:hydroxyacylglutathione hydrolase